MTYEPYFVCALRKDEMEYELETEGTKPEDYRPFHYIYKSKVVQLELF